MAIELPKRIFGRNVEGAIERVLEKKKVEKKSPPTVPSRSPVITSEITNPENWLLLEGRAHGNYSYDNLFVEMHRLGISPAVEQAASQMGLTLQNTAKEQDGTSYIGKINWPQAIQLNLRLGNETLVPRQGIDLLVDLQSAISKKKSQRKTLYDAAGNTIPQAKLVNLYNEIVEVRDPWRAEWLDADFKVIGNKFYILQGHYLDSKNNLVAKINEEPDPYVGESGVEVRLSTFNRHGLPTQKGKGIHYWAPMKDNKSVARFFAYSDRADLDCNRVPANSDAALGVRAARRARAKNSGGTS